MSSRRAYLTRAILQMAELWVEPFSIMEKMGYVGPDSKEFFA
jgi:hypothetical protein